MHKHNLSLCFEKIDKLTNFNIKRYHKDQAIADSSKNPLVYRLVGILGKTTLREKICFQTDSTRHY